MEQYISAIKLFIIWITTTGIGLIIGLTCYIKNKKDKEDEEKIRRYYQTIRSKQTHEINKNENQIQREETKQQEQEKNRKLTMYRQTYEPRYLMTINEKNQFHKIMDWAKDRGYYVFTKVRLLDLITPRSNKKHNEKVRWKIQSRHIDFAITDSNIKVIALIEILDNSHKDPERIERDEFVRTVLQACGYKYIETYNITEEELDSIN